jgi:type VI protein secretion system component Hcp
MDVGGVCFGASASGSIDAAGHPRSALAAGDVSMWKRADIASDDLYHDYLAGATYPTATISSVQIGGNQQRVLTVALSDAKIDGLRTGGRGGVLNEDLSLSWASMTVSVYTFNNAGAQVGTDTVTIAR